MKKKIHLIANAHIDPVWLWRGDEGAAAALATFRSAADLLEKNDFIFCHNEALLYQWIEEYDPALFTRIQKLVAEGKWVIAGGWYLQPDCNMPSGESMVRQIGVGNRYFERKFGAGFKTALSLDAFGHSVGLVQILKKCGYENYLVTRPHHFENQPVPKADFIWRGLDGSEVKAMICDIGYASAMGAVEEKVRAVLEREEKEEPTHTVLWGVGNHGGGPSQADLDFFRENPSIGDYVFIHSTPDALFDDIHPQAVFDKGLNRTMTGCYTSLVRIKQKHRRLENLLWATEKLACACSDLIEYPSEEFEEAERDLLFCEFHDILPGSCVREGEEEALEILDHGLRILKRIRSRAFFALADTFPKAKPGEYLIFVFNPHPYTVRTTVESEIVLENQNWSDSFSLPQVSRDDRQISTQLIRERSSLNLDWVKRFVFEGELKPMSMNCFSVRMVKGAKPEISPHPEKYVWTNECGMTVQLDPNNGLIKGMSVNGKEILGENAFRVRVYEDNADPWAMGENQRDRLASHRIGEFVAADGKFAKKLIHCEDEPERLRLVESGELFWDFEAIFHYKDSYYTARYRIYRKHPYIDVFLDMNLAESDTLFKFEIPAAFEGKYVGQIMFGREELLNDGAECVAQKWTALTDGERTLCVLNDGVYGSSMRNRTIEMTLARSGVYAAHPIAQRPLYSPYRVPDRFDQGRRNYRFRIGAFGLEELDREAQLFNEQPFAMNYFPAGKEKYSEEWLQIADTELTLVCCKRSVAGDGSFILRIQNGSAFARKSEVFWKKRSLGIYEFAPFEVATFRLKEGRAKKLARMEL